MKIKYENSNKNLDEAKLLMVCSKILNGSKEKIEKISQKFIFKKNFFIIIMKNRNYC